MTKKEYPSVDYITSLEIILLREESMRLAPDDTDFIAWIDAELYKRRKMKKPY